MLYLNKTPLKIKETYGFWAEAPNHRTFFTNILERCNENEWEPLIREAKLQAYDTECLCPTFNNEEDLIKFIHFLEEKIHTPFIKIKCICK